MTKVNILHAAIDDWYNSHVKVSFTTRELAEYLDKKLMTFSQAVKRKSFDDVSDKERGKTFDDDRDRKRINKQGMLLLEIMKDGKWRTKSEIEQISNGKIPCHSCAARLSEIRRFGMGHVDKKNIGGGLWKYRVL